MFSKDLIYRKLRNVSKYLDELEKIAKIPYKIFEKESFHYAAEKLIELMVEMAIDINLHIIKEKFLLPPTDYKESFTQLGKEKILPIEFARKIAGSAGLRNLLVHHYEEIDIDKLYRDLKNGIKDYQQYCHYIEKFVEENKI